MYGYTSLYVKNPQYVQRFRSTVYDSIAHSKLLKGEEEALFLEYRKQLKVLFDNIAQLVR